MAQTLGQQLKQIREARGISLEEIAQKTHIRPAYITAIESGDVDALPSQMQMRGFLRLYASELGVEIDGLQVKGYHLFTESTQQTEPSLPEATVPLTTGEEEETEPTLSEEESENGDLPVEPETSNGSEESLDEAPVNVEPEAQPVPPLEPPDPRPAQAIFTEIGEQMRERRELLSLSLQDIETHIHLRKHYLTAIESGRFEDLPSPVQARGMLANYAEFLNLDVDALLLSYADGLQKKRLESQVQLAGKRPAKELSPSALRLKNFFSLDLLVLVALFIVFAGFVVWGVSRILSTNTPETAATDLPEVSDVLLATGSPTPQLTITQDGTAETAEPGDETPVEATPLFTLPVNNNPIAVVIIPRQSAWIQVTSDDEVIYEGRVLPGNAYDYSAQETLEILTGSAGALQIYFNDQDVGSIGLIGQVSSLIFSTDGLVLPTPTQTPPVTETPQTSPTATPSPTPPLPENDG